MKTLRALYIEQHRIAPAQFEQDMLKRTLYPHARFLRCLMPARVRRHYFDLDLEFVRAIGALRQRRDFNNECSEFMRDPANRRFSRGRLRLRVSGQRTRQIVDETFGSAKKMPAG
ncbi:MAG: hypothetical protein HY302_05200 [Opitutae bacterium]|nr:hypothetical protein [Opitutae bacterium]